MNTYPNIPQLWRTLVPSYRGVQYAPLLVRANTWDPALAQAVYAISPKRAEKRCHTYLLDEEVERVKNMLALKREASVRFGAHKSGRGYNGPRGDFCLVGGCVERKHLTLMYRSLELIGGFGYDLCLIQRLGERLGVDWKSVTFFAASAFVFAPNPERCKSPTKHRFFLQLSSILEDL